MYILICFYSFPHCWVFLHTTGRYQQRAHFRKKYWNNHNKTSVLDPPVWLKNKEILLTINSNAIRRVADKKRWGILFLEKVGIHHTGQKHSTHFSKELQCSFFPRGKEMPESPAHSWDLLNLVPSALRLKQKQTGTQERWDPNPYRTEPSKQGSSMVWSHAFFSLPIMFWKYFAITDLQVLERLTDGRNTHAETAPPAGSTDKKLVIHCFCNVYI